MTTTAATKRQRLSPGAARHDFSDMNLKPSSNPPRLEASPASSHVNMRMPIFKARLRPLSELRRSKIESIINLEQSVNFYGNGYYHYAAVQERVSYYQPAASSTPRRESHGRIDDVVGALGSLDIRVPIRHNSMAGGPATRQRQTKTGRSHERRGSKTSQAPIRLTWKTLTPGLKGHVAHQAQAGISGNENSGHVQPVSQLGSSPPVWKEPAHSGTWARDVSRKQDGLEISAFGLHPLQSHPVSFGPGVSRSTNYSRVAPPSRTAFEGMELDRSAACARPDPQEFHETTVDSSSPTHRIGSLATQTDHRSSNFCLKPKLPVAARDMPIFSNSAGFDPSLFGRGKLPGRDKENCTGFDNGSSSSLPTDWFKPFPPHQKQKKQAQNPGHETAHNPRRRPDPGARHQQHQKQGPADAHARLEPRNLPPAGATLYCRPFADDEGNLTINYTSRFKDWLMASRDTKADPHNAKSPDQFKRVQYVDAAVDSEMATDKRNSMDADAENMKLDSKKRTMNTPSDFAPSSKRSRFLGSLSSRLPSLRSRSSGRSQAQSVEWKHVGQQRPVTAASQRGQDSGTMHRSARSAFSRLSWHIDSHFGMSNTTTSSEPVRKIKICMVGDSFCGKTSLINRMANGQYKEAKKSATYDFKVIPVELDDGRLIAVEMWDLPGDGEAVSMALKGNFFHAAIICYSVEKTTNISNVGYGWCQLLRNSLIECPVFLIATKKDLRRDFPTIKLSFLEEEDQISHATGVQAMHAICAYDFYECSARTGEGVESALRDLVAKTAEDLERLELRAAASSRAMTARERSERVRKQGRRISRLFSGWTTQGPDRHMADD